MLPGFTGEADGPCMSASKKSVAGKRSGIKRAKAAKLRQFFVLSAFERLRAEYRIQPFSDASIDALEEEFRKQLEVHEGIAPRKWRPTSEKLDSLLDEAVEILTEPGAGYHSTHKASRDTLIKDLKALGIKSKMRKDRSG